MNYVQVYIEHNSLSLNQTFTYQTEQDVSVGCRVKVPFGHQTLIGFVDSISNQCDLDTVKSVLEVLDPKPLLNVELLDLASWMSDYYVTSKISCLKTMLPPALKPSSSHTHVIYEQWAMKGNGSGSLTPKQTTFLASISFPCKLSQLRKQSRTMTQRLIDQGYIAIEQRPKGMSMTASLHENHSFTLTSEQKQAVLIISKSNDTVFLLHGVTGSGKTEVFLQLAQQVLSSGKQVLFLVPEIGLTPMMINQVSARFGKRIAIYHSQLNAQEKYDQYRLVKEHKVDIVVGTRSAVFMPFSDLGLILMDEEHDSSYKQENMPRYHTRDIVKWRANYHGCKVVLASATPSLESYARAYKGVYHLVTLTHRISVSMPMIHLVDMKTQKTHFGLSQDLLDAISIRLNRREQTILLLNRRGYLPIMRCMDCGQIMTCPDCGLALSYHKKDHQLMCHCCGRTFPYTNTCPSCGGHHFYQSSMGTEKLEEQLRTLFPSAHIIRMDADTTRKKRAHQKLLSEFERSGDILLGTQMVAKGLDFARVSLVGIINADSGLARLDFSSNELTYDLLEQASGRSGRQSQQGEVFIQTFDPNQYVMRCVLHHDYQRFFKQEMQFRHLGMYPPYVYMCTLVFSDVDSNKAMKKASQAKKLALSVKVLGPVEISMRQKKARCRLVLKAKDQKTLHDCVWKIAKAMKGNIDINMYPMLLEE